MSEHDDKNAKLMKNKIDSKVNDKKASKEPLHERLDMEEVPKEVKGFMRMLGKRSVKGGTPNLGETKNVNRINEMVGKPFIDTLKTKNTKDKLNVQDDEIKEFMRLNSLVEKQFAKVLSVKPQIDDNNNNNNASKEREMVKVFNQLNDAVDKFIGKAGKPGSPMEPISKKIVPGDLKPMNGISSLFGGFINKIFDRNPDKIIPDKTKVDIRTDVPTPPLVSRFVEQYKKDMENLERLGIKTHLETGGIFCEKSEDNSANEKEKLSYCKHMVPKGRPTRLPFTDLLMDAFKKASNKVGIIRKVPYKTVESIHKYQMGKVNSLIQKLKVGKSGNVPGTSVIGWDPSTTGFFAYLSSKFHKAVIVPRITAFVRSPLGKLVSKLRRK